MVKFKVGDVVRVKDFKPIDEWLISFGPDYPERNGAPEMRAVTGDIGVVVDDPRLYQTCVRWLRSGAITGCWTHREIEHVEVDDVQ